ncbi:Dual specificity protein phosphatase 14 [Dermatophagoides farinae]|uniref:Dual specificity protein phosphatase 14 n=1 Tax=Dermatophagoides farinae TaxID=6954 RepID=A0A922ICY9_DERFA|nr:Dual specificity protein phosphatase 14 [Dermatophagoides farinae]
MQYKRQRRRQRHRKQFESSSSSIIYSEINQKSFEFLNGGSSSTTSINSSNGGGGKNLRRTNELLRYLLQCESIDEWSKLTSSTSKFRNNPLFRDQTLTKTITNKPIMQIKTDQAFTKRKIQQMRIYQTGTTGLIIETMQESRIRMIINATYEMPLLKQSDIITFRVPVEDDCQEPIQQYFDDVADLMEAIRLRGHSSVIHCMAGVSRSATLILAYMVKYTTFTLYEAFLHIKSIRQPIRPNIGFIQQLIQYEARVNNGRKSVDMEQIEQYSTVAADQQEKVKILVPKFYRLHYPELYELEIRRQLNNSNCTDQNNANNNTT